MHQLEVRTFTEEEYHSFFRQYIPDPMMDPSPFTYQYEQISRSYRYNHGGFREHYAHFGVFLDNQPVGSLQLKEINEHTHSCSFGIILQNDSMKNRGIGRAALRKLFRIARDKYDIHIITGDTMSRNKRMIHVFEKLGFTLIETVPNAYHLPDAQTEDRLVYQKNLLEEV